MPIKQVFKSGVPIKVWTEDIDSASIDQLKNIAQLPFIHSHIAVMPDVHLGKGATVGSVIPTKGAIIPAAVGVDIGCGMEAVNLSLTAEDLDEGRLREWYNRVTKIIPLGAGGRYNGIYPADAIERHWITFQSLDRGLHSLLSKHGDMLKMGKNVATRHYEQAGTLGSGNHFIELCLDESGGVWIMLHSGSRGIGNIIGRYFIEKAKEDMKAYFVNLPDRDLAYIAEGSKYFRDYTMALSWAQQYARFNRDVMMGLLLTVTGDVFGECKRQGSAISCHHNYVEMENHYGANVWITRKGAIRARHGQLGIIPGSMGDRSYIVEGLAAHESFCSAAHGAGRHMSRSQAKRTYTVEDHQRATKGVLCRQDEGVLDETPAAYKRIDEVMENQSDLVKVRHTLKQVVNVKG